MLRTPLLGEFMGTFMMILLGDGVVAAVLLKRTKAENSGWLVIATGWCFAVMCGIFTANLFGSPDAHLNPAITLAFGIKEGSFAKLLPFALAQLAGAFAGAALVWIHYGPHWPITEDKETKASCLLHCPRHSSSVLESRKRDHRDLRSDRRCGRHHIETCAFNRSCSGRQSVPGELPRVEHRPFTRRNHRLCHQPGARSWSASRACHIADSGQGRIGLGLCAYSRDWAVSSEQPSAGSLLRALGA